MNRLTALCVDRLYDIIYYEVQMVLLNPLISKAMSQTV